MRKHCVSLVSFFAACVGTLAFVGCAPIHREPEAPLQPVSLKIPTFSVVPQAQTAGHERQSKGGLTLSLAAVNSEPQIQDFPSYVRYTPIIYDQNLVYAHKWEWAVSTEPVQRLRFLVTINNQMPRVFHGSGAVVQFNVAGHLVPVDQNAYASLQNAIIPPGNEQQITIDGPELTSLPEQGTLGIFFYDVVTNQNDAGAITEKQNFEWYYTFTKGVKSVDVHAPRMTDISVPPYEFETLVAQSQVLHQQWHVQKAQLMDEAQQLDEQLKQRRERAESPATAPVAN